MSSVNETVRVAGLEVTQEDLDILSSGLDRIKQAEMQAAGNPNYYVPILAKHGLANTIIKQEPKGGQHG